jgi:rRNA maturation RNase YbeY
MTTREEKLAQSRCRFFEDGVSSGLKGKRKLGALLNQIIWHYSKTSSFLSYTFVSDEALYQMNLQYLQHDTYTDIITFNLSESNQLPLIGDVYISVDRVRENARQLQVPYAQELLRVIIHGSLHLSGFDDRTAAQKEEMRRLESHWMKKYVSGR